MTFVERTKEALLNRLSEGVAAALTVLIAWVAYAIVPVVLPAIASAVPTKIILALLLSSLLMNIIFAVLIWSMNKRPMFVLKYGIYWDKDKNAHCPSCQKPVATYGEYSAGKGYYCKPCKKVFPLADASGNDIDPAKALSEL
ncbi:MAG TPA: hypothetical protein VIE69_05950 [Methylophilaceae bacterium]|jgi:hypothetical protein